MDSQEEISRKLAEMIARVAGSGIYYIFEGKQAIPCSDLLEWGEWMNDPQKRIVKKTRIRNSEVSTVFLGLDHNYLPGAKPLLFETMVFGGKHNLYMQRYNTYEQALKGHQKVCEMVIED